MVGVHDVCVANNSIGLMEQNFTLVVQGECFCTDV